MFFLFNFSVKSENCDPTDTLSQLTDFKSEDIKDFDATLGSGPPGAGGPGIPPGGPQGPGQGPGGPPPGAQTGPDGVPRGPGMGPGGPDGQFPNGKIREPALNV